uniref:Metalloendopeptidase n=1 Tax=Parastrongyloides trichosuri TaxID=131310 RepID=A0A0N4Z5I7_PARTI
MYASYILLLTFILQNYASIRWSQEHRWNVPNETIKIYRQIWSSELEKAKKSIEEHTCVKFEIVEQPFGHRGIFVIEDEKCYADHIGPKLGRKVNFIFVNNKCKNDYFEMLKLFLHTLGVTDEHNRDDRNDYIDVDFDNVFRRDWGKLRRDKHNDLNTTTFGTSYDYGSMLHGSTTYYSKSHKRPSIKVKGNYSQFYDRTIGQRRSESFNEYRLINYLYCNHTCNNYTEKIKCEYNGYQDPNNCGQCKCPYFTIGKECNSKQESSFLCRDTALHALDYERNYTYYGYKHCYAYIHGKGGGRVKITVTYLWLGYYYNDSPCSRGPGSLEIKYKADKSVMGLCLCAYIDIYSGYGKQVEVTSENSEIFLIFMGTWAQHTVIFKYVLA